MNIDPNLVSHWAKLLESQDGFGCSVDEGCERVDEVMAGGEPDLDAQLNNEKKILQMWVDKLNDQQCVLMFKARKNEGGGTYIDDNGAAEWDMNGSIMFIAEWDRGEGSFDKQRNAYVYIPPNYMLLDFQDMYTQVGHFSRGQGNGKSLMGGLDHVMVFPDETRAAIMSEQPLPSRHALNSDSNVVVDWNDVKKAASEIIARKGLSNGSVEQKKKCFQAALGSLVQQGVKAQKLLIKPEDRKHITVWTKDDILNMLDTWDSVEMQKKRPTRLTVGNPNNKFGVDRSGRDHGFDRLD